MVVTWCIALLLYWQVVDLIDDDCFLKNVTLHVNVRICRRCMAINTTTCSGFCHTQDTNMKGFAGKRFLIQQGCMHQSVEYQATNLTGCRGHADHADHLLFYYPVATHCHCARCNTTNMECIHPRRRHRNTTTHCPHHHLHGGHPH
ncbi:thyrotropin subunit beta-like [Engraulis encrasicolus]|uniref:thyrotropin subunit beta-like n=1 Tax=Engraulis encrasicolus TaxID=184585 RepID=UPI002FD6DE07